MQPDKTVASDNDNARDHRKELYAVSVALSIMGIAFSSWAARVPDVRDAAMLTAATLGYALMFRGGGNILMMPAVAILINTFGAKKTALFTGLVVVFSLYPLSVINHWLVLGLMLFVVGAGSAGYNISVNALGAKVESESGRSHMSGIHSWFGIGNLFGALLGIAAVKFGVSVELHFAGITVLLLGILLSIYRFLPDDAPHPDAERPKFQWPHGGLIVLGLICFLAATIETSIMNWVGLFFTDHVQVADVYGPVGYTVFAGALLGMRLIGDRLKTRFGAKLLLVAGPTLASFGLVIAVFAPGLPLAVAGILMAGAGVSLSFPMVFSAAGREGAIALTSVATFGYIGGMVSQPVLGQIVEQFELFGGFLFLSLCCFTTALLASRARLLRHTSSTSES